MRQPLHHNLKFVHYSGAFLVDDPSETYTYNNTDGTLSSFSALYGDAYTYTYDGLKRLQSTQVTGENATFTKNYGYATNSTGTSTLPNLLTYSNSSGLWMSNQLTYDNMNRIVTSNQTSVTSDARTYVYDDLGQLIEEQIPALDLKYYYRYDNAGNMIKWQQVGYRNNQVKYEANYTYGDADWQDRLTAYDGGTIFYEGTSGLMGNLDSVYDYDDGKNIYWDAQGHLDYVYLNDGTVLNYNFNASGQLESKWVDGESLSLYKYEGDRLISQTVNGVNFLIFLYDESGNVDAIKYRGEKYYLVRNIQGDVVELRDEYGGLVAKYTYNAYGYLLSVRDQYTSEITDMTHIAHINPIRYRGYYYDTDLKWYYLNSRYYSPELCRFISSDSLIIMDSIGMNLFAYCVNDPINYIDPSGHCIVGLPCGGSEIHDCDTPYTGQFVLLECEIKKSKLESLGFQNVTTQNVVDLNMTLRLYDIDTKNEIAHFLSQCATESGYGMYLTELGSDEYFLNNGYGTKYRGSGYIQLTWDYNYKNYAEYKHDSNIYYRGAEYVASNYAWDVSGWWWTNNNMNEKIASGYTVRDVTATVRGSSVLWKARQQIFDEIYGAL